MGTGLMGTAAPAPRPDTRLEDGPMRPVDCAVCGAEVLARKSSWDQTSIQWTTDARTRCVERALPHPPEPRPNRNAFAGCAALKDSVREAAVRGELEVQSHEPLKISPEAHQ
ncbi:MAG: ferredoxin [Nocardioides sp.]